MANKYHGNLTGNGKHSGGSESGAAKGGSPKPASKMGTAAWPGLPGKTQGKDRSGGTPKKGYAGPFYVKSEGL